METIYQIEKDSSVELLNHIEQFKDKMDKFIDDHINYKYEVIIEESINNKKIAKLIVIKNEETTI